MVFENPSDQALLEAELKKRGLSLQQLEEIVDSVVPIISQAIKIAAKVAPAIFDAVQCTISINPEYWHYYKHAKKLRTRKKYRNKLLKKVNTAIKKGAFI